jgi:twitching motility two-component system response regulator PilH
MAKKKILIIDDSETNNILIRSLFEEKLGYEVVALNSSLKVLEKVKKYMPDIILLDLMMPYKDGFEVLSELKSNAYTKNIPVVIVSAKQEEEDIAKARNYGAVDYIRKPIGNNSLVEKVEKYLSTTRV